MIPNFIDQTIACMEDIRGGVRVAEYLGQVTEFTL
jgi:hypothetical protein